MSCINHGFAHGLIDQRGQFPIFEALANDEIQMYDGQKQIQTDLG